MQLTDHPACETASVPYAEEELVTEARGGSLTAFQRLVECYEARVFRLAHRIAHSREDAEDITQDAFMKAFKNMPRFRGDSRFSTWIGRITINESLMKMRGRRVKQISVDRPTKTGEGVLPREFEDWRPNPEERYSQEELQTILTKTIAQLSPTYRTVFQLREVEGFSTEETAAALDVSLPAVKSRLRRARLQMQSLLNRYLKPIGQRARQGPDRPQAGGEFTKRLGSQGRGAMVSTKASKALLVGENHHASSRGRATAHPSD